MSFMYKKASHPSGAELLFHAKYHSYKLGGMPNNLKSVSTVLGRYFPFDSKAVATKLAASRGCEPADILKEWNMVTVLGSNVHAHIEQFILKKKYPPPKELQGLEEKFYPVGIKAAKAVLKDYEILGVEEMIASKKYGVAGTIDLLAKNKKTGAILIGDWKTSQKAHSDWLYSSFDAPALPPISHLTNTKMVKYALQTMLYGYIMRTEGYEKKFGDTVLTVPMEFGICMFAPKEGTTTDEIGVRFYKMDPKTLLSPDDRRNGYETSVDDILVSLLKSP